VDFEFLVPGTIFPAKIQNRIPATQNAGFRPLLWILGFQFLEPPVAHFQPGFEW